MTKRYLHIKIIISALACCFFINSCADKKQTVTTDATKRIGIEVGKNVVVKYSVGRNRKAFLKAPLMYRVSDTVVYTEFPNTVHVDFYGINDTLQTKLDAHYAKYKESESKVLLRDSVTIINVKGDTLHCKTLYWDRNRTGAEFYTNDSIRIRTKKQIINGVGMEAQQDFKTWHIIHPTGFLETGNSDTTK